MRRDAWLQAHPDAIGQHVGGLQVDVRQVDDPDDLIIVDPGGKVIKGAHHF